MSAPGTMVRAKMPQRVWDLLADGRRRTIADLCRELDGHKAKYGQVSAAVLKLWRRGELQRKLAGTGYYYWREA